MVEYDFYTNNGRKIWEWINSQPNKVSLNSYDGERIICEFNHDANQQLAFKQEIIKRFFQLDVGNNTLEDLMPKLNLFQRSELLFGTTPRLQFTNIPITFTDFFPSIYQGFPIPISTIGFKKMGFVLLWNKNGGTGLHDIRLVKCDNSGNLLPNSTTPDILISGTNIPTGRTTNFNFDIPTAFLEHEGFCKIQAKSSTVSNNPILDALYVYLIRG